MERRYQNRKDGLERAELLNVRRAEELKRLQREHDDIHGRAFKDPDSRGDCRVNPPLGDEDARLLDQLTNGPRLAPHRGASELFGAARESREDSAHIKLQELRRDIRREA